MARTKQTGGKALRKQSANEMFTTPPGYAPIVDEPVDISPFVFVEGFRPIKTNTTSRKNTCSFCGGLGHNRRGCEFADVARSFFLPANTEQCENTTRKCSFCHIEGHYCITCPFAKGLNEISEMLADVDIISEVTRKARAPLITHTICHTIGHLHTQPECVEVIIL